MSTRLDAIRERGTLEDIPLLVAAVEALCAFIDMDQQPGPRDWSVSSAFDHMKRADIEDAAWAALGPLREPAV